MQNQEQAQLDADYSPSRLVASLDTYLEQYQSDSAAVVARFRDTGKLHENCRYGPAPTQRLHLLTPSAPSASTETTRPTDMNNTDSGTALVAFIHGGFWKALSADASVYAAPAWLERGVAFAAIGYTLAPKASLGEIVEECNLAVDWLFRHAADYGIDANRISLCGHSAGAHLVAMCVTHDWSPRRIAGAALVGGVFELEPISRCYVNDVLSLSQSEIEELSPVRRRPVQDVPVSIVYGENETEAFKQQSVALAKAWGDHTPITGCSESLTHNHFDLIQQLGNPDHEIFRTIQSFVNA